MRPIDELSVGPDLPGIGGLERVEEILRSAADFEPETEATYNFAAAAMSRRRFRSRVVWIAVAACTATAIAVWLCIPKRTPAPQWPPWTNWQGTITFDDHRSEGPKQDVREVVAKDGLHVRSPQPQSEGPAVRLVSENHRADGPRNDESILPKAKWENETVDRYATGLVTPTYVEERNADGSRTQKPALIVVPLESGEKPAPDSGSDVGMMTVSDVKGDSLR